MNRISGKLRIGEKIGLGFGLVGIIFLAVIWQYHSRLQQTLDDYQQLLDHNVAGKVEMLKIESNMREARRAEKEFLLLRDELSVEQVLHHIGEARKGAALLIETDVYYAEAGSRIEDLIAGYRETFNATVDAWRRKGLDHNSGLQGAFRNAVHELETMAGYFKVDNLYLQLLQIRRGEKDLGLRREAQYIAKVLDLIGEFERKAIASELEQTVKSRLQRELQVYRKTFTAYAQEVLAQADIKGGKGPFRQAAHRIEGILQSHHLPDLASNILQLRRREKDYLLRDDKRYVDMAMNEWNRIHAIVESSAIATDSKEDFLSLLSNYKRDFLALVEQNDHIGEMTGQMQRAVAQITGLVRERVDAANRDMTSRSSEIKNTADRQEQLMLLVVAAAALLGILFAFLITVRIVRPLRAMAGILDQLAYQETSERLPYYATGRDEVNAMAGSVNMMAENKSRFINWWKSSMREASACEALESALNQPGQTDERLAAVAEFREALSERHELLFQQFQKLHKLNNNIMQEADALDKAGYNEKSDAPIEAIQYASRSVQNILEMVAYQERHPAEIASDKP